MSTLREKFSSQSSRADMKEIRVRSVEPEVPDMDLAALESKLGLESGALDQVREWQTTVKDKLSSVQEQSLMRRGSKNSTRGSTFLEAPNPATMRRSLSKNHAGLLRANEGQDLTVEEVEHIAVLPGSGSILDGRKVKEGRMPSKDVAAWEARKSSNERQPGPGPPGTFCPEPVVPTLPSTEEHTLPAPDGEPTTIPDSMTDFVPNTFGTKVFASIVGVASVLLVIIMCVWAENGLLPEPHTGHVHTTKTRVGHVHAPLFTADKHGLSIALHGTEKDVFDLRFIIQSSKDFGGHRRLAAVTDDPAVSPHRSRFNGKLSYRLLADGMPFYSDEIQLSDCMEVEYFKTVDVRELGFNEAEHYTAEVSSQTSDGLPVAFLFQALRMGVNARWRVALGLTIFIITFVSIVTEKIHRSYSAFLGSSACLALLCAIQETPHLHTIAGMIDYGTLMLLFSMMILMHMLASTGFFSWFALRVVKVAKQKPKTVFFLLTNLCGWMSMVLDNVTVVLLTGPLVFQIAKRTGIGPRPLYLAMTICATIGGTATLIGDPPNIVIASKMQVGFASFLMVNLPIVGTVLLPISSVFLWFRLKEEVIADSANAPPLDYKALELENRINHEPRFGKLVAILLGIFAALLTAPIHGVEPAWFSMMGMMAAALMFDWHHFGHFLEFVEWDTLFFFAILFVLVETLSELGVIRAIGDGIIALIMLAPEESRMYFAVFIVLWLSAMGSAFLESLPFTTTFVYILLDLLVRGVPGVQVDLLIWPLSIGACVGGIGSIMGSSANLVCMAVSNRYGGIEEDKVHGGDFLKFGFPTLLLLMVFSTIWLFFLFMGVGFEPPLPGAAQVLC